MQNKLKQKSILPYQLLKYHLFKAAFFLTKYEQKIIELTVYALKK